MKADEYARAIANGILRSIQGLCCECGIAEVEPPDVICQACSDKEDWEESDHGR